MNKKAERVAFLAWRIFIYGVQRNGFYLFLSMGHFKVAMLFVYFDDGYRDGTCELQ
jgi:hypothetical protein